VPSCLALADRGFYQAALLRTDIAIANLVLWGSEMPGIAGIISRDRSDKCQSLLRSMIGCMVHENFYVSGSYSAAEMGVYGGWVALAGSFASNQVFSNERKDIALLFSGECFLDHEAGTQFEQTEVSALEKKGSGLIDLYEKEGDRFFEKLDGLFSGLLIDKRKQKAYLFNDRYGIERIYACETGEGLYFASEAKALLRVLPECRSIDEKGVAQLLTFGCTLEWQTLFRGVRLLPGGSLWAVQKNRIKKGSYFSPSIWESQPPLTEPEFESEFKETFKRILPRYLGSASRIGLSLTGGLDTRMITACLPNAGTRPLCYTFTGQIPTILDSRLALRIAAVCGMEHQNLQIGTDFFSNFSTLADKTVYVTDGCFGVLGAHEVYFNGKARQLAPVRLTGNFGSEVLRGMSTFKPIGLSRELFTHDVSQMVESCAAGRKGADGHPISFAAFKEIPWNLFGSLAAGRSQVTFRTPYLDNEIVALAFRVPNSLQNSSLVALHLVKENNPALARISTDRGRGGESRGFAYILRRLFCDVTFKLDYIYSEDLPNWLASFDPLIGRLDTVGILGLHKFLRYRRWLRKELAAYLKEALANARSRQMPYWNADFLERMAKEHISGQRNYVREINAVLTLESIDRLLLRGV
jgi:asparagine synthase (glutamine-hydrolysing)